MSRAAVLGAGSWGTALAIHCARIGHDVRLWGRDAALMTSIASTRRNERYLPDIAIGASVCATASLEDARRRIGPEDFHHPACASLARWVWSEETGTPEDESGISAPRDWVSSVSIAPSVAAMNEALDSVAKPKTPSARPGTANVLSKANLVCREQPVGPFRTFRYLVLDNIAVIVATSSDPSLEERVFITQLANALQTQIAEPTPSPAPSAGESVGPSPSSPTSGPTRPPRRTPKPGKNP